jgi:hypothetical protein
MIHGGIKEELDRWRKFFIPLPEDILKSDGRKNFEGK